MEQKNLFKKLFFAIFFVLFTRAVSFSAIEIIATSPVGRVEGRDAAGSITVTFSKPMVPLEKLPEGNGTGPLQIKPDVKGKFRWLGSSTLSFTPAEPLPLATEFEAFVPEGIKSEISGETLNREHTWRFETLRPDILSSYPREHQDWVELDENIFLVFNQTMEPRNVKEFIKIKEKNLDGIENDVDFTARYAVEKDSITFRESYHWYTIGHTTKTYVLVLIPNNGLKKDCFYSVELARGLPAKEGTLGLFTGRTIHFGAYKTFVFVRPESWDAQEPSHDLKFVFTNPVKVADLLNALSIEPKIDFPEYYYRREHFSYCDTGCQCCPILLSVRLKPNTTYFVKIKGALTDKYGQVLGKDVQTFFVTTDYDPRMSMPTGIGIVERYMEPARHPIDILNVAKLRLQMAKIAANNIVSFGTSRFEDHSHPITPPGGYSVDKLWEPKIKKNVKDVYPIELKDVLGASKYGIVYLQVDALRTLADGTQFRQAFLQVTSMGVTGKFSPDGNLIYVSYLKTANPVMDCNVELRSDQNKLLWLGKTDKNGFVRTPGWEDLKIIPESRYEKPKIWVIAAKGEDTAFIHSDWGTGIYPYHFNIPYECRPEYPEYGGHIFSERGIYRPGETVYIKGIVREKRFGKWEIPRITGYKLFIKDSRSQEVVRTTVTLSNFGSFDYTYKMNKDAPTGYYTAYLWQKDIAEKKGAADESENYHQSNDRKIRLSSYFRVEEYKPATFEVEVSFDKDEYILCDTATVRINGRYLFGAPLPDAELQYTLRLDGGHFSPEGNPGYVFGGGYWDDDKYFSSPGIISSGKAKVDKEGNYTLNCPLISRSPGSFNLIAEGIIAAPDRQQLAGRKTAVVHAGEYYIGLKPETTFIEKGKNMQVEVITVAPDGKKVQEKELFCTLKRIEWNSIRKAGFGGRLEWQTEKVEVNVASFTFTSAKDPYKWIFTPDKSGFYIFIIEGKDSRDNTINSSQHFYVTGRDYCAWARSDDDRIELVCDKEKYKPGETAKILVKSPYESANAVVTIEREGIIDQFLTKVVGSADTIAVPITADHLPNIFVCVMLYQGRLAGAQFSEAGDDLRKPSFKIGYTNLPVDPGTKHLSVTVEQNRKEYRPGDEVKLKLNVKDYGNKGVKSEVTLGVVDKGILNLINYQTPDSFPVFYGPRSLSVETAETRLHVIGQRNYGEKGENRGGSGGIDVPDLDVRMKFLPTVYWNPRILTDENGAADISFTLPDNLTTFKIMASARTKDSCFGAGDNKFVVNKELILKPSLPRFARIGDKFSAGVLCHNNSKDDGTVEIEVNAKGIKATGETAKELKIKKGEAKEVRFDFTADKIGDAEFVFKARLNNATDGLKWTIPVSVPRPTEAVATYSSTESGAKEGIKIPSDIYDDASSVNISIAPTALVGLKGGVEYLFDYPYGCLEQKTSKILPLILAADFIDIFNLAPLKEHTARELITGYLKELPEFQHSSGGFSFWKNGEIPSEYLTAYALWAIAKAKEAGYEVNENMRTNAIKYLRSYIRGESHGWTWPYNINAELCAKAFCLYALSINGVREQSYINNLYHQLDQMPVFGKIYLLKAAKNEGMDSSITDAIVREINNKAKFSPTEVHFEESDDRGLEWIWHSNVRLTAAVLQCMLEVKGEYPNAEKVARWLTGARKAGRWLTTQENIYVFYAFSEYVKKYEKETPNFSAKVLLDGKEIMKELFSGRTLESRNIKLAVSDRKRDVILPVAFDKIGKGRLYYDLRMIYAPRGRLGARAEGLALEKTIESFKSGKISGDDYDLSGRYKVTIKVKTDQERHFVVVDDPLPSGFEVVNLNFATESQEEAGEFRQKTSPAFYRWWGSFDHWENYDDRVLIFANYLERGEHTYSYLIQATTPGSFLMPASKAEEMYTPEVFGMSEQKFINIK